MPANRGKEAALLFPKPVSVRSIQKHLSQKHGVACRAFNR